MEEGDRNQRRQEVVETGAETGSAIAGALVGLALGGPLGAVVGAAASPVLAKTAELAARAWRRKRARAERIVDDSFIRAGLSAEQAVDRLLQDDERSDKFFALLSEAAESDSALASAFSGLLAGVLTTESAQQRERALITGDALRGLRTTHLRILQTLASDGPVLRATDLARLVQVPEVELRGVVRDLELRGMIKDRGVHPIEWELRELGKGVVAFARGEESTSSMGAEIVSFDAEGNRE